MPFLLERLAACPIPIGGRPEAFDEVAAVHAQIQRIFVGRTVQGSGAAAALDWGVSNVVELGQREMTALVRYAELARRAILQYEPRLKDPVVTVEPQPDALTPYRLQIVGSLAGQDEPCAFTIPLAR